MEVQTDTNDAFMGEAGCQTSNEYALVPVSDVVDVGTSIRGVRDDGDSGKATHKYKGLQNQGATWYLNSLIQTLYMTPEFRNILYSWNFKDAEDKFNKEYCIPLQLQILFGSLQSSMRRKVSTKGLTRSFNWQSNEVSYQQDIQEFCRVLFNAIEESFKAIEKPWHLQEIYQGGMDDYLKCTECGYESNRFSEFLDLSLPIHDPWNNINNSSLEEALENYVRPEVLDDDNKYQCSGCNKKVRAVKGHIFEKLPEILVIQLNRFTFNMYGNAVKINDKITFPYVLNMNKLMEEDVEAKIKQTEQKIIDDQEKVDNPPEVEMETEEEKKQKKIDEVNKKLDAIIENKKNKEDQERQNMGDEDLRDDDGIDYSDPMNSLDGPKIRSLFGNTGDEVGFEYNYTDTTTDKPKSNYFNSNRDDETILNEIEQNTLDFIKQGEWVYQLYSVLIHSGGVSGGHYTAYIKSFEDHTWYHFNDSVVSEISIGQIEKMHGDGQSSKNAYLVMYKKLKLKNDNGDLKVDDSTQEVITNDQIPDYVQEEVKTDNDTFKEEEVSRQQEEAHRREQESHVTLRVLCKTPKSEQSTDEIYSKNVNLTDGRVQLEEKKFDFKDYQTIGEAKEFAYKLYELESKGIDIKDTQLRFYSVGFKIMKQTLHDQEDKKLKDLGISLGTPLFLETKKSDEQFDHLPADMIPLRYYLWNEGIQSIDEAYLTHHILFVNKNHTIRDLQQDIIVNMTENGLSQDGQTIDNNVLYKEKYTGGGVHLEEITIDTDLTRSLDNMRVSEGSRVFVDFRTNPSQDSTNWEREFTQHANRFWITFNNPLNGPVDQWANDEYRSMESTYENTIFMECDQTCLQLKQNIATEINLPHDEFKIMKSGIKYEEIADLSQTLYEAGLYKTTKVFIELGKPTNPGTVKVLIYEAFLNQEEDNELFNYSDLLFELDVSKKWSVRDFKSTIAEAYKNKYFKDSTEEFNRDRIRIRDKGYDRLGKVMRDGKNISEYGICLNKAFAIQVLPHPEIITEDNDIMVVIREWLPGEGAGSLTEKKEVLFNRKMRYHEVTEALKNQGIIPETENPEDYDIWKVSSIIKFIVEDLPNEKWVQLNSNGGFSNVEGSPMYLRSDGYLVIIRNREYFKAAPIVTDESNVLPVGSLADSISSKYDRFDIRSSAVRVPYLGGGRSAQKGVTIQVMDKKTQEEEEKKKKEEKEKRQKEMEDERGDEAMSETGNTKPTKTTKQRQQVNNGVSKKDTAVGGDAQDEEMAGEDIDVDFLFDLEDA